MLKIEYCEVLNVYSVHYNGREMLVTPDELEPGGRFDTVRDLFEKARLAVLEGRAVLGVHIDVEA